VVSAGLTSSSPVPCSGSGQINQTGPLTNSTLPPANQGCSSASAGGPPSGKIENVLKGHDATLVSCYDNRVVRKEVMKTAIGFVPFAVRFRVATTVKDIPYTGDRRLVCDRSVLEHKQPMRVVEWRVRTHAPLFLWAEFLVFCACISVTVTRAFYDIGSLPAIPFSILIPFICINVMGWAKRDYCVTFIPHVVSAVVLEYSRGTNLDVVRTTIRQKVRRLASLPVPDEDALLLLTGSEMVAEALILRSAFFTSRARIMTGPGVLVPVL